MAQCLAVSWVLVNSSAVTQSPQEMVIHGVIGRQREARRDGDGIAGVFGIPGCHAIFFCCAWSKATTLRSRDHVAHAWEDARAFLWRESGEGRSFTASASKATPARSLHATK
jgi:hypothetical protein